MTAKQMLQVLRDDGWIPVRHKGSHVQLKHPTKIGTVTVPIHSRPLKPGLVRNIMTQAGLRNL